MKSRKLHKVELTVLAAIAPLMLGACGAGEEGGEAGGDSGYGVAFEAIEGLSGQERTDKLVELAEEAGKVTVYSTNNEISAIAEAFTAEYGLEVETFEPDSEGLVTRIAQEASADRVKADIVDTNGPELAQLAGEELLVPFEPLGSDRLIPEALTEGNYWIADRVNVFSVVRNVNNVPDSEAPKRWEDLADPKWKGTLVMEPADVDWFWALYNWFVEDQGMAEDEATKVFEDMAANAAFINGHTDGRTALVTGEYDLVASDYRHGAMGMIAEDGAPLSVEPPVLPIFARPNGAGLVVKSPNPAGAILFLEWLIGDVSQQIIADDLQDAVLADLTELDEQAQDVSWIDIPAYLDDINEYTDMYDAIQRSAG